MRLQDLDRCVGGMEEHECGHAIERAMALRSSVGIGGLLWWGKPREFFRGYVTFYLGIVHKTLDTRDAPGIFPGQIHLGPMESCRPTSQAIRSPE
jgi:hypothetical protein